MASSISSTGQVPVGSGGVAAGGARPGEGSARTGRAAHSLGDRLPLDRRVSVAGDRAGRTRYGAVMDFRTTTLADLVGQVGDGTCTAQEVVAAALDCIDALDGELGAF